MTRSKHELSGRETKEIMVQQYLETALWSSIGEDDEPLDGKYSSDAFTARALSRAKKECAIFIREAKKRGVILAFTENASKAGHNFWLTRNRHGAGFWDDDFFTPEEQQALTDISHGFGEMYIYEHAGSLHFL